MEDVIPIETVHRVAEYVRPEAAPQSVDPEPAGQDVVAGSAIDEIVPAATVELVVTAESEHVVGAVTSDSAIGAVRSRNVYHLWTFLYSLSRLCARSPRDTPAIPKPAHAMKFPPTRRI